MIEIERKFRVSSKQKATIEQELHKTQAFLKPKHQIDAVFLHGIDSFKDFKQGMPITRLRTENDVTKLAYKRRINEAGDMVEHELTVSSAETMQEILAEMDFRQVTVVDKVRLEIDTDGLTLALDSVKGLGDFLEIEVVAQNEDSIPEAEKRIMAKAVSLGLTETDIESRKYDQLVALAK
jgi:adenylate cyclase class 2